MPTCLIGMSGGVDSSVAAFLLLEQGYDCIGVTMRLCDTAPVDGAENPVEDAQAVCRRLGIPHHVLDLRTAFDQHVMGPFAEEYEAGRTPNPCIFCNRTMKFEAMWQYAKTLGCDCMATGHYAQIVERNGGLRLQKAADPEKDQTYVLYFLSQAQLAHTRFPLGGLTKAQVRQIAETQGFGNAKKQESQDICFIPDGDYGSFLERYTGNRYAPGDFVDASGRILGRHKGAVRYTLGQRKGLGIPAKTRLYVTGKDMSRNTVTLGQNEALFATGLWAGAVNLAGPVPQEGLELAAKIRYRQKEQPCRIYPIGDQRVLVQFHEPQRAISPGQAVVFYDGDTVFGGGTIEKALE